MRTDRPDLRRPDLLRRGRILDAAAPLLTRAIPLIDRRLAASTTPFDRAEIMRPELHSRRWAWTHYGFFVPDLPEPYRYVNTMTLIGSTGTTVFDNTTVAAGDARTSTTVLSSTAQDGHHHYRAYDGDADCDFAADGSRLVWGDDLQIDCTHPEYRVRGDYGAFAVDLTLRATDQVSYFVDTPIYQHFSVLAPYRGTLTDGDRTVEVAGLGTVEYARCSTPQVLRRRPVGPGLRLPVDFFTYQVVPLTGDTQLLLTDVRATGATACRLAQIRSTTTGRAEVIDDVQFSVLRYQETEPLDTIGEPMRVPAVMRWDIGDRGHLVGTVDAPLRAGHGRGFVGAYSFTGVWDGVGISGSAYLEWIDCEKC